MTLDLRKLRNVREGFNRDLRASGSGPVGRVVEEWGTAYLQDAQEHYASEGGGDWKELSPRTQRQRARLGFPAKRPILTRLGIVFRALFKGAPGNLFQRVSGGVRVGFNDQFKHPGYRTPDGKIIGGGVPVKTIAIAHDQGKGRVPKRRILVNPTPAAAQRMVQRIWGAVRELRLQMKTKEIGRITGKGPLYGLRAERLRVTPTGTSVCVLLEPKGAWKVGDKVHVGTGEFQPLGVSLRG